MTDKEFRRLSRADLVEIIYELQQSEKALQQENRKLKEQLEQRNITISQSGSLAEVLAKLNGLFNAAQATADDYTEQARRTKDEADQYMADIKKKAANLAALTVQERKDTLAQTEEECRKLREEAKRCPQDDDSFEELLRSVKEDLGHED